MKKLGKLKISADKTAVLVCTAVQLLIGAGLLELYVLEGWLPLVLLAFLQLVPAVTQLVLLLPFIKAPQPATLREIPQEKGRHLKIRLGNLCRKMWCWLKGWYYRRREALVIVLIAAAIFAGHMLFWKPAVYFERLDYAVPVVMAVLVVLTIVMDVWCKAVMPGANEYNDAQLKGIRVALKLMRVAFILALAASVLRLLELFNADKILKVALSILFVYETVFLAFTLTVRAIRREMGTHPEILVSIWGVGSDTSVLRYLEEHTGITMRSLWSLRLVKQVLPVAVLGVVLVLWLSTGVVQIQANEQGALYRMGQLQPEPLQPGLHFTLPWPFDKVDVYDTKSVQKATIGYVPEGDADNIWTQAHGGEEYRLLLGGGEEIVSVNLLVEYRIGDLIQYVSSSASPESILQAQAYEIVTARTISTNLDTLLAADREVFAESFRDQLARNLDSYGVGLEVVNVVLESIHPPVEIAATYQDIISAGIDAQYIILMSQAKANTAVMSAKQEVEVMVGEARADQFTRVAEAKSSVATFMSSMEADQQYGAQYRFQKYMQAIMKAYGDAKIVIVGQGVDAGHLYIGNLPGTTAQKTGG